MASPVEQITQAIQYARTRRLQQQELDQQSLRDQKTEEYHQGLLDLQKKDHDLKSKQLDATLKAAQALHKAQLLHDQQEMVNTLQSGRTVPGATLTSTANGQNTYSLPLSPNELNQPTEGDQYLPGAAQTTNQQTQVTLPTPQAFAQRQADIARTILAPKTEAATQLQGAKDTESMKRITAVQDAENIRAKLLRESQAIIARNHDRARITAAGVKGQTNELGDDPTVVGDLLHQLATGQTTQESIKKNFPKSSAQLFAGLTKSGMVPLTDKQTPLLQDLGSIKQLVDLSDQLNNLQKAKVGDTDSRVKALTNAPGLLMDSNVSNIRGQITAGLAGLARTAGGLNRLNMQEINQAKGLTPDLSLPPSENTKRLNNLKVLVGKLIDQKLANIPVKQRNLIKQTYGLDQFTGDIAQQQQQPDTKNLIIKLKDKRYKYNGNGDTSDINNYQELQ